MADTSHNDKQREATMPQKVPRWTTSWPDWYGVFGNTEVVPASDYDQLRRELDEKVRDPCHPECMTDAGHSKPCIYAPSASGPSIGLHELRVAAGYIEDPADRERMQHAIDVWEVANKAAPSATRRGDE